MFDQKYKKLLSEWTVILAQISFFFLNSVCEQKKTPNHYWVQASYKLLSNESWSDESVKIV